MADYNYYDVPEQGQGQEQQYQQQPDQQQNYFNDIQSNQPDTSTFGGYDFYPTQNQNYNYNQPPQPQQQQSGQLNAPFMSEIGPRSTATGQDWFDQQGAWDYGYAGPRNSPDFVQRPQDDDQWKQRWEWMQNNFYQQPGQNQQGQPPQAMSAWSSSPNNQQDIFGEMNNIRGQLGQPQIGGAFTRPGMQQQGQPQQPFQEWFDRPGIWGQGMAGPEDAPEYVTRPRNMADWTDRYYYYKLQEEQRFNPNIDPYVNRDRYGNVIGRRANEQPNPAINSALPAYMRPAAPRPPQLPPPQGRPAQAPARPVYRPAAQPQRGAAPALAPARPLPPAPQLPNPAQAQAQAAQAQAARAQAEAAATAAKLRSLEPMRPAITTQAQALSNPIFNWLFPSQHTNFTGPYSPDYYAPYNQPTGNRSASGYTKE